MRGRQIAPDGVRREIASCLRDGCFRIYPDGQRYLDLHGLVAEAVVDDLANEIERFEIFRLPQQSPGARKKYDYVIRYDEPELFIHVKMTPMKGEPPIIFLGFHSHNIPGLPLPQIPLKNSNEER